MKSSTARQTYIIGTSLRANVQPLIQQPRATSSYLAAGIDETVHVLGLSLSQYRQP